MNCNDLKFTSCPLVFIKKKKEEMRYVRLWDFKYLCLYIVFIISCFCHSSDPILPYVFSGILCSADDSFYSKTVSNYYY